MMKYYVHEGWDKNSETENKGINKIFLSKEGYDFFRELVQLFGFIVGDLKEVLKIIGLNLFCNTVGKKDLKIVRGNCTVLPGIKTIEEQHLGRCCPAGGACIQRATTVVPPSYSGDSYWIQTSQIHTISSLSRCSRHQELVSGIFFLF